MSPFAFPCGAACAFRTYLVGGRPSGTTAWTLRAPASGGGRRRQPGAAGQVINASEEKVRDLLADFRQATYQAAIQLRTDAAQAAFPPPLHPQTGTPLQNKGPDEHTLLTVNGRISLSRRRYAAAGVGSSYPLDSWLDRAEDSLSLGLRELACRLNLASRNFDKAAENLGRAAQVHLSGEFLRQVVESEGKAVQAAAQAGKLPLDWSASDCPALDKEGAPTERSRVYLGSDGVMVPHVTDAEKRTRRERIKAKRRRGGRKRRPLPKARSGADGSFKEFKIVTFYDDDGTHRLASATRGDCTQAGRLMRRDAARIRLTRRTTRWGGGRFGLDQEPDPAAEPAAGRPRLGLLPPVGEPAQDASRRLWEEDPKDEQAPGNAWVGRLLHTAKHEGYEALRERLQEWKGGCVERAAVRRRSKY